MCTRQRAAAKTRNIHRLATKLSAFRDLGCPRWNLEAADGITQLEASYFRKEASEDPGTIMIGV